MMASTKSLSASYMGVRYGVTERTACFFILKVSEAMEYSRNHPMEGVVHVHEFVQCGVEKGKIGRSYDAKKKGRYSGSAYRRRKSQVNVCYADPRFFHTIPTVPLCQQYQ